MVFEQNAGISSRSCSVLLDPRVMTSPNEYIVLATATEDEKRERKINKLEIRMRSSLPNLYDMDRTILHFGVRWGEVYMFVDLEEF